MHAIPSATDALKTALITKPQEIIAVALDTWYRFCLGSAL